MTIQTRDLPANDIGELAAIYSEQIAGSVPHCYPVSPEEFDAGRYGKTGNDYTSDLEAERVLVGLADGEVRGFAHVRVGEIVHREQRLEGGFIHFLTYAVGHREVGQALLSACERHCREMGTETVRAFDG